MERNQKLEHILNVAFKYTEPHSLLLHDNVLSFLWIDLPTTNVESGRIPIREFMKSTLNYLERKYSVHIEETGVNTIRYTVAKTFTSHDVTGDTYLDGVINVWDYLSTRDKLKTQKER